VVENPEMRDVDMFHFVSLFTVLAVMLSVCFIALAHERFNKQKEEKAKRPVTPAIVARAIVSAPTRLMCPTRQLPRNITLAEGRTAWADPI
jgi:hypothetical protein